MVDPFESLQVILYVGDEAEPQPLCSTEYSGKILVTGVLVVNRSLRYVHVDVRYHRQWSQEGASYLLLRCAVLQTVTVHCRGSFLRAVINDTHF